jgi:hypothetical protein
VAVGALLAIAAAGLSGCVQAPAKATGAWQPNVSHKQSFTRLIVVGVTPNVNQRCAFEFFMVSQITSDTVQAVPSCSVVTQKSPLTRESIEAAVASQQADAVLATRLVSREFTAQDGGSRDTRGGAYYKATDSGWATGYGYYGVYGVPVVYGSFETAESITTVQGQAHVVTQLFETRGKTMVYAIDTTIRAAESRDTALHDAAAAIADTLRKAGLVH